MIEALKEMKGSKAKGLDGVAVELLTVRSKIVFE